MSNYHGDVWNAGTPPGNLSSVNWGNPNLNRIKEVHCVPLATILQAARTNHVNAVVTMGRNTWFMHKNFVPSSRPGIDKDCYSGFRAYGHLRATDGNDWASPLFKDFRCSVAN